MTLEDCITWALPNAKITRDNDGNITEVNING